jgi:hypothetical protein
MNGTLRRRRLARGRARTPARAQQRRELAGRAPHVLGGRGDPLARRACDPGDRAPGQQQRPGHHQEGEQQRRADVLDERLGGPVERLAEHAAVAAQELSAELEAARPFGLVGSEAEQAAGEAEHQARHQQERAGPERPHRRQQRTQHQHRARAEQQ